MSGTFWSRRNTPRRIFQRRQRPFSFYRVKTIQKTKTYQPAVPVALSSVREFPNCKVNFRGQDKIGGVEWGTSSSRFARSSSSMSVVPPSLRTRCIHSFNCGSVLNTSFPVSRRTSAPIAIRFSSITNTQVNRCGHPCERKNENYL